MNGDISDPMDREKNGVKYEILEYMNEKIDAPLDDLMYDLVDELLDEPRDDSEYSSSDERMENTDFYLTELTQTEETQCPDQVNFSKQNFKNIGKMYFCASMIILIQILISMQPNVVDFRYFKPCSNDLNLQNIKGF